MAGNPHAVLMAGGSGTRFWPASRRAHPKQFLSIGTEVPLLTATADRLEGLLPPENIWVVTGAGHAELVREVLPNIPADHVLAEPVSRNTLPCVALATAAIARVDPEAVQIVLPADHVVSPPETLRSILAAAVTEADAMPGALFTLGIEPTFPATGYGWIEMGEVLGQRDGHSVHRVERFVEKPNLQAAQGFLDAGRFLWNSGMFVWRNDAIQAALKQYAPGTWEALKDVSVTDARALGEAYADLKSIPIDIGVLERATDVRVLPVTFTWNDVGTWSSIPDVVAPDADGNFIDGDVKVISVDATGNVVHAPAGQTVALLGVENLVVVRTKDAILVCPRERAQDVRSIVARLESEAPDTL
jgi:mannose-1-phosphate guanylyltransferase